MCLRHALYIYLQALMWILTPGFWLCEDHCSYESDLSRCECESFSSFKCTINWKWQRIKATFEVYGATDHFNKNRRYSSCGKCCKRSGVYLVAAERWQCVLWHKETPWRGDDGTVFLMNVYSNVMADSCKNKTLKNRFFFKVAVGL